jgi:hypothetical protein
VLQTHFIDGDPAILQRPICNHVSHHPPD